MSYDSTSDGPSSAPSAGGNAEEVADAAASGQAGFKSAGGPSDPAATDTTFGLNFYGQPIIAPEYFDHEHIANPMSAGLPPCCSCGWTPHEDFTMADHLADMEEGRQATS